MFNKQNAFVLASCVSFDPLMAALDQFLVLENVLGKRISFVMMCMNVIPRRKKKKLCFGHSKVWLLTGGSKVSVSLDLTSPTFTTVLKLK